jgi:pimeloyl-ACP methyl ester carboxylesterase
MGIMTRLALLLLLAGAAQAADRLVNIDTRPGVKMGYWLMEREGATATVVLLPGGKGSIGMKNGAPTSENFLVRSRDKFAAAGFNVAVVGRPSDREDLDLAYRTGDDHMEDLRRVAERLKRDLGKPVWLVGTSRGTTSAAAAAVALGTGIDGLVLTSSITDASRPGAVQNMALDEIRVPALVMHHRRDACRSTPPGLAPRIVEGLGNAPAKRLAMVDGGSGAYGDPCEPMHWHGFIGMEQEAVDEIVRFIRDPKAAARP